MTGIAQLLRDLVSIPSVNPMGRPLSGPEYFEYQVTAYLERFFRDLGVRYERQTVAPLRDNIIAYYEPDKTGPVILLEAHQDTVPAENMTIAPFEGRIDNGRLYGRGACDIKGGMAAMLAAFARVVRERPPSACPVTMACVVDEEFTFRGITELVSRGVRADLAVVAEPTRLAIVNAHKGAIRWRVETRGRSCHSSNPEQGINAIYRMGKVITALERLAYDLPRTRRDPVLGPPSISVGRIEGGVSVNIVPDNCYIEVDRRLVSGEDPAEARKHVADYLQQHPVIDFEVYHGSPWLIKPALSPEGSEVAVARLGAAIDAVLGGHRVESVAYGTDASSLAEAGIPSVVFGPGDIAKAHTADEWVDLSEVEQASDILYRMICQE